MGELILMLLLTCAVCGGIPALAFAYVNGKIKFSNHGKTPSEKQKRTVFRWLAFLLGSFMGCFLFPTYNFTKTYPNDSHCYVVPHHGCVLIAGVPVQKGLPIKNDAYAHGIQFFIYFGGAGLPLSSGVWRGFKHIQLYSA